MQVILGSRKMYTEAHMWDNSKVDSRHIEESIVSREERQFITKVKP